MATEKSFSLVNTKRPARTPADTKTARRNRLIGRLSQQIEFAEAAKRGEVAPRQQRRLAKWYWQEGGQYFVSVYYTRQPLEIGKGKFSAQCADLHGVVEALASFRKSTENGDFDQAMEALSEKVKAKFAKAS